MLYILGLGCFGGFCYNLIMFICKMFDHGWDEAKSSCLMTLFLLILTIKCFLLIGLMASKTYKVEDEKEYEIVMHSANGGLFCLTVRDDRCIYHCKVRNGFKRKNIALGNASIDENDIYSNFQKVIEKTTIEYSRCPALDYLFTFGSSKTIEVKYEFYIPKGSINFQL